jgi:hypothetical protein
MGTSGDGFLQWLCYDRMSRAGEGDHVDHDACGRLSNGENRAHP